VLPFCELLNLIFEDVEFQDTGVTSILHSEVLLTASSVSRCVHLKYTQGAFCTVLTASDAVLLVSSIAFVGVVLISSLFIIGAHHVIVCGVVWSNNNAHVVHGSVHSVS
jgi:hypothetical protein